MPKANLTIVKTFRVTPKESEQIERLAAKEDRKEADTLRRIVRLALRRAVKS